MYPPKHEEICEGCKKPVQAHPCPAIVYEIARETILRQARRIIELEQIEAELQKPPEMAA